MGASISKSLKPLLILIGVCILITLLVVFKGRIFMVSSSSMQHTILPGDLILMNKISQDTNFVMSLSEIPLIGNFSNTQKTGQSIAKEIKRNEILIFKSDSDSIPLIKRCIGLPGESIDIKDNLVKINHHLIEENNSYTFEYQVNYQPEPILKAIKKEFGCNQAFKQIGSVPQIELSIQEARFLQKKGLIVKRVNHNASVQNIFPKTEIGKWTAYNYGELWIPKKNATITINDTTMEVYGEILRRYENIKIEKKKNRYYHNGLAFNHYRFKKDYYFMLGDNRHNAIDSRYFGFVPFENIRGKAELVLLNTNKITRCFKSLN
jgi:signal peptidase I